MRSSARMRCHAMGTFFPPLKRSNASAREAFQRQRFVNIGDCREACTRSPSMRRLFVSEKMSPRGKLCCSPSERTVQPGAERRVNHELHAAGLVEEPLSDQRLL